MGANYSSEIEQLRDEEQHLLSASGRAFSSVSLRKLCRCFAEAHHLHHLRIVGHHHRKSHQLRVEGAKILCNSLIQTDELNSLALPWNDLGDAGCNILANAVQVNQYNWRFPFTLDLSFNRIGERGGTILSTALRSNRLITHLDVRGNNLSDRGAGALCAAFKFNNIIETVNLQSNSITDLGATLLAEALNLTTSVKKIDLWGNVIRHRGALAIADAITSAHGETPIEHLRIDEAWLPINKLFGVSEKDRSLNFRDCHLGTLDAIVIARLITRNTYLYSLDLSKNNLTGPGKSPLNVSKQDFSSSIQIIGEDNEKFGSWNDQSSDDDDDDASNDNSSNNSESDGEDNGADDAEAKARHIAKFRKKPPPPPKKDMIEGVEVNYYGIYLILKNLALNKHLRRLRLGQKDAAKVSGILEWVWNAVRANECIAELLVSRQV